MKYMVLHEEKLETIEDTAYVQKTAEKMKERNVSPLGAVGTSFRLERILLLMLGSAT
jgi:hypothetical protein